MWPSEFLRLFTFLIGIAFFLKMCSDLITNKHELNEEFQLPHRRDSLNRVKNVWLIPGFKWLKPASADPTLLQRIGTLAAMFYHYRCSVMRSQLGYWVGMKTPPDDTTFRAGEGMLRLWDEYNVLGQLGPRLTRIALPIVMFFLLGFFLTRVFGEPAVSFRGPYKFFCDTVPLILSVGRNVFLTLFVLDAALLCGRMIKCVTNKDLRWTHDALEKFTTRFALDGDLLEEWLDINLIAKRTTVIMPLIYYPFITLSLLVLARSNVFDNWNWPWALIIIISAVALLALGSVWILRGAAERARSLCLERMHNKQLELIAAGDEKKCQLNSYRELMAEVEKCKVGAFAPLGEQPILRALLLPFGGAGILALTCVLTLVWLACGYSLAFTDGGSFFGGFSKAFLSGVGPDSVREGQTIPELVFFAFQMMFFLITPGLFVGAFAERMKFSAMLIFSVLWSLLVYIPVCYCVWYSGNFFGLTGVIDLAGGIVVHITAGVAALVACIMVGPRTGHPATPMLPHNLPLTVTGAGMLWVGWFGFNAGSQLAANGAAAMTLVVTHVSAATAAVVWMVIEWWRLGKPSVLGIATGSIAGLAAITPASGTVGPVGALCIGATSAVCCWLACAKLKKRFRYDDSLDVFGVHGVGGFVGTILVAVVGTSAFPGGLGEFSVPKQLGTQLLASIYTILLSGIVSYVVLKVLSITIGLRVQVSEEREGLDLAEHGESGYND